MVIEDFLGLNEEDVLVLAPTAAAANRLKKQWSETYTIQKALYHNKKCYDKDKGQFFYSKKKKSPEELEDYKLILVDESSMVDYNTFLDIKSFEKLMLFMGDKAQLPPVKKQFINKEEDILFNVMDNLTDELTENFRQSEDSGILKICRQLRKEEKVKIKSNKDVLFLTIDDLKPKHLLRADQIITSTNKWRQKINRWMSKEKGNYSPVPVEGEKIIFTENNYDVKADSGECVVNSLMGTIEKIGNVRRKDINFKTVIVAQATIKTDLGTFSNITIDIRPFIEGKNSDMIEVKVKGKKGKHFLYEDMCRIDYGYAITTHKSQGQEWDKVLFIQSSEFPKGREESWQEAYTACSRAKSKMIVVPNISAKSYMWQKDNTLK